MKRFYQILFSLLFFASSFTQGPQILFHSIAHTEITEPPTAGNTRFGASGPSISSPAFLISLCGSNTVSRSSIKLDTYNGNGSSTECDKYLAAGIPMFLNITNHTVERDNNGDKVPNPFPTDLTTYQRKIEPIFKYYSTHPKRDKLIMVCENEPTTQSFYTGPMSDYIAELKVFVATGKKYGLKCADGGVHVITVNGADDPDGQGKSAQVAQLLAGYASIPDLYAVNLHTNNSGGGMLAAGSIKKAVDKIFKLTGHKTVSNEWHVTNGTPAIITDIVKQWRDAGIEYSVYITGTDPGEGSLLNVDTRLTAIGTAYRDAVQIVK